MKRCSNSSMLLLQLVVGSVLVVTGSRHKPAVLDYVSYVQILSQKHVPAVQTGAGVAGSRIVGLAGSRIAGKGETTPRIAIMVLAMKTSSDVWHDAFAVFAYATRRAFAASRFALDLLAVAEESIGHRERQLLEGIGFQVLAKPPPVPGESVRNEFARTELTKGCLSNGATNTCEEVEMLKLYGVALTKYHRVIISDGDLLFLNNIDELLGQDDHLIQATYDHELDFRTEAGFTNQMSAIPLVNSGFVVVKPNQQDFDGLVESAKEGDFRSGSGWKGYRVGWGFGGIGPQGLFAYYYNKHALEAGEVMSKAPDLGTNMTTRSASSRILPLDRSVYNVIDTPDLQQALHDKQVSIEKVKVFHFTGNCLKPWMCQWPQSPLCKKMTDMWWQLRTDFAASTGAAAPPRCEVLGKYEPVLKSVLEHSSK